MDWEDSQTLFFVVLHEKPSRAGRSACACANALKQGTVSCQFVTVGHSTFNDMTEFDVRLETGVCCFRDSMELIGAAALKSCLEANAHHPKTHRPLRQLLQRHDGQPTVNA